MSHKQEPVVQSEPKLQPTASLLPVENRTSFVKWGVHLASPLSLIAFIILGTVFATVHHVYYAMLDSQLAGSSQRQQWSLRIGTGLAILTKASLAGAITIAFTQHLWTVLNSTSFSLNAMDSMFAMLTDLKSFKSLELLQRTKILCLMAVLAWYVYFPQSSDPFNFVQVENRLSY